MSKKSATDVLEIPSDQKQVFELWRCEILFNKQKGEYFPSRLKQLRDNVKITSEQAATINSGVVNGLNTFCEIYFVPNEYKTYPGMQHETLPALSTTK